MFESYKCGLPLVYKSVNEIFVLNILAFYGINILLFYGRGEEKGFVLAHFHSK